MPYSVDRITEILSVESAALPTTDPFVVGGGDAADTVVGTWVEQGSGWPRFAHTITYSNITLLPEAGDDTLNGDTGNDALFPGPGDDEVLGGSGTDAVAFVDSLGPVTVDLGSGYANEANGDLNSISDVENVLGSEDGDHIYGDSGPNVLDGWEGDDVIQGRAGIDDLRGGDGDDVLDGGGDADTILDGEGNDTLTGGDGDDTLLADVGDDLLEGGADDDTVSGGSGIDTASYASATAAVVVSLQLQGGTQNTGGAGWDELWSIANLRGGAYDDWLFGDDFANTLEGVDGADHLYGNDGNDLLRGGPGTDTLSGGDGIDRASYIYANGGVTVSLTTGTATGAHGSDTLTGIEELGGSNHADTLTGDDGDNTLLGANGDDLLRGGFGNDTLDGGNGSDTGSWRLASGGVTVHLALGTANGAAGTDTLLSVENAIGTDGYADTLTGGAEANRLEGWGGDDLLRGGAGADTLDGGAGSDLASYVGATTGVTVDLGLGTATGGDGPDTLLAIERVTGSAYGDSLTGTAAAETLDGSSGDDNIGGGGGNDTLIGGPGSDWARYSFAPGSVTVDLLSGIATGADGNDTLSGFEKAIGSGYGDTLLGDGVANVLQGWGGDDLLRGRGGNDTLDGGAGLDRATYDDATGAVTVDLGAGTATGAAGSDTLTAIENLTGSETFGDALTGDGNINVIEGRGGDDVIEGGGGNDVLDGGTGTDLVSYEGAAAFVYVDLSGGIGEFGAGADTLAGFENLTGSAGWGDQLIGDAAGNEIDGLGGDDTIVGQGGADELSGGAGADIFMYNATGEADDDFALIEEIEDFVSGSGDVIHLAHIDTDLSAAGDQAFTFIGTAAFSATAVAEVRFSGGVVYADTDNDVGAEMAIALTGVSSVVATDFVL